MERVEVTFIKHFANSNRSKGMNILRPKKKREKHRITFSMGKDDVLLWIYSHDTSIVKYVKVYSLTKQGVFVFAGFAFGCTVALLVALVLIIRARHILDKAGRQVYMDTLFPLYR